MGTVAAVVRVGIVVKAAAGLTVVRVESVIGVAMRVAVLATVVEVALALAVAVEVQVAAAVATDTVGRTSSSTNLCSCTFGLR